MTQIADAEEKLAKLNWGWAGHVCCMYPDWCAKVATERMPEGSRDRARQTKKMA